MNASLFITCIADLFYPEVGKAVFNVLRDLGVMLDFPSGQTCCGQPLFNSGFFKEAKNLAGRFLKLFAKSENIVVPSGSCAYMVKEIYPTLFENEPQMLRLATEVADKTFEFTQFLGRIEGPARLGASLSASVAYHDSCHLLNGLGVEREPRDLLKGVNGLDLIELKEADVCCGFGGTFSVKLPDISAAIMARKIDSIAKSRAQAVVAADLGCLMHIGGGLKRRGLPIKTYHIAEILASRR